jgi:ribosome biogenesis protein Tsr3
MMKAHVTRILLVSLPFCLVYSLPVFIVRLAMWDFCQCDAKKCTGRKCIRFNLVHELRNSDHFGGIVLRFEVLIFSDNILSSRYKLFPVSLSPSAREVVVSPADRVIVQTRGLAVIDCSWARIPELHLEKLHYPHANDRLRLLFFFYDRRPFPFRRSPLSRRCKPNQLWQAVHTIVRRSSRSSSSDCWV